MIVEYDTSPEIRYSENGMTHVWHGRIGVNMRYVMAANPVSSPDGVAVYLGGSAGHFVVRENFDIFMANWRASVPEKSA